ncbi:MAG: acyl-CoA oxidase [Actinomycetota bacterium]|nr:acyl-CoA oxidase [Actinomycetota bacterium]
MTTTERPSTSPSGTAGTANVDPATPSVDGATLSPSQVDPVALRRHLDGQWADVRESARELYSDPLFRPVTDLSQDEHRRRVTEQVRALADTGRPRVGFPEEYGGSSDVGATVNQFAVLAFGDLSLVVKSGVQFGLFAAALLHLGTERHHRAYLPAALSFELPGAFAMTETGHGSDVASVRTTATYDGDRDEFVIDTPDASARKDYIGNAALDGRAAVVFAQLVTKGRGHGVHAFVVPIRDHSGAPSEGVEIEDCGPKAGLNGVDNGRLSFHDVRVPRDALLDRYGSVDAAGTYSSPIENEMRRFFTMLGTLIQGRVSIAGAAGSATKSALAIALRYAESRRQFRAPGQDDEVVLLDYLTHQRRLLPALATTYAQHFAHAELAAALHEVFASGAGGAGVPDDESDRARREVESRAAGIKAAATWHATRTIQECREACGGAGYLAENRLPQLKADSDVFTTFEGDNTVLMQLVAKGLLTSYRDEFGDLDTLGTVRFVASQMVGSVIERTAAAQLLARLRNGRDDEASLLDREHQRALFAWREQHVLEGLARRLRRAGPSAGDGSGGDVFDGFNRAQTHLVRAAAAHVDRVVLEAFSAAVASCPDHAVRRLLDQVCDLYALSTIEADRAWFLEHGRLTPRRSKALVRVVDELCRSLRPHALTLVDGFGVPDETVRVPMLSGAAG